jgi:hypothetical protein
LKDWQKQLVVTVIGSVIATYVVALLMGGKTA